MTSREEKRLKKLEMIKRRSAEKAQVTVVWPVGDIVVGETVTVAGPCQFLSELADCGGEIQPTTATETCISSALTVSEAPGASAPSEPVLAKIYGIPVNRRIRLIEFADGSHGKLWVKPEVPAMLNWSVWVKADSAGQYKLHGNYNVRGIRTS